jgi:hypothetical protein
VQLRLQAPALDGAASVVVVGAAAVETQVFRQSIACVSQVARHRAASAREQHQQEARQQTAIAKLKSGNHPTEVAEFDAGTFERHRQLLLHLRRKTHGQSPDQ